MNIPDIYITMCEKGREIQADKYVEGFQEEDRVFCGDIVRIVGHDFISLQKKMEINPWNVFRFAMSESSSNGSSIINNENLPDNIEYNFGIYTMEYLKNPVWLPYQHQLQDMLDWEENGPYGVVMIDAFYDFAKQNYDTTPFNDTEMTWDILWLSFVYHEKYNKRWIGMDWEKIR